MNLVGIYVKNCDCGLCGGGDGMVVTWLKWFLMMVESLLKV